MADPSLAALAKAINTISTFISHDRLAGTNLAHSYREYYCIILCASAILGQATNLFRALELQPELASVVVLVGGIGHSTSHIYDAVARHPIYHVLAKEVQGLPEARVLELITRRFFNMDEITSYGCQILIEDQSTNCGANASETKALFAREDINVACNILVVQDPTMCRRTVASFEKVYERHPIDDRPGFIAFPIIVPTVKFVEGKLEYEELPAESGVNVDELWEKQRFYELLVGEVARLHDDQNGYGPKGKGFTGHVEVPEEVLQAAELLRSSMGVDR